MNYFYNFYGFWSDIVFWWSLAVDICFVVTISGFWRGVLRFILRLVVVPPYFVTL
ncbi:hypothetical protein CLF_108902, partial [Clonorchis sinensis]